MNDRRKPRKSKGARGPVLPRFAVLILAAVLFSVMMRPVPSHAEGADRGVMSVEFLYSIEYSSGRSEKFREPFDIFFDRKKNELYIVDAGQSRIYVYDNNGMFLQEIKLSSIKSPPGMVAVDGRGNIHVGYVGSPKISVLDYKGEPLENIDLPGIVDVQGNANRPLYLSCGSGGEVYALKKTGGIVKVDPRGGSHEELSIAGDGAPNMIYGMTVDAEGRFLFTDMRPYSVVVFDSRKKEFKRFGTPGVLYGQITRPTGIAADDAGHIFVLSGTTSKVSCYDRDGNFIEEFGRFGDGYGQFYMPSRIASDGKDRLFVLENTLKRVQVFKIAFLKEEKQATIVRAEVPEDKP